MTKLYFLHISACILSSPLFYLMGMKQFLFMERFVFERDEEREMERERKRWRLGTK